MKRNKFTLLNPETTLDDLRWSDVEFKMLGARVRSVSPTGDMASTTCRFERHFSTK